MKPYLFLLSLICLIFSGCASVKVDPESVETTGKLEKPTQIYVQAFDTSKGEWNVDREGDELETFKQNASKELSDKMIERFQVIAPTQKAPNVLPSSGLLVAGEFVKVNQGSRALRATVGFGAGATKVITAVRIYNLSRSSIEPVLSFETTGGSGSEPGVGGGGAGVVLAATTTGLGQDWNRTAKEMVIFINKQIGGAPTDSE